MWTSDLRLGVFEGLLARCEVSVVLDTFEAAMNVVAPIAVHAGGECRQWSIRITIARVLSGRHCEGVYATGSRKKLKELAEN